MKKVIALGYADPAHIGLQGHSWGGYQSWFILTQTNMFAAVVTGAPPTDLISFYGEMYKQSGTLQRRHPRDGQGRMGETSRRGTPPSSTRSQSPVFNVTQDPDAVHDPAGHRRRRRRLGPGTGVLQRGAQATERTSSSCRIPDEPHHLAKKPNQIDFQIRMKQFFDHYLKGAPEPEWMKDGVPQTKKGRS